MAQKYDALIVGGGAAAMVAAITLGRTGKTTTLLERLERVGKKNTSDRQRQVQCNQ